ncbi:type III pantothenate kinase [Mycoplasmopsis cynos]|uniref:type III pantothenate kinase n=1 Tax=Mycoplasmopsis cynos TaxID=171284 RepID=UPI002AFF9E81|nr:type III pantothenate kinase [Mycoplasmopsis cynos]WQQ18012.1 type III pantothenate kinase [Mycoplasmopsis cynos]
MIYLDLGNTLLKISYFDHENNLIIKKMVSYNLNKDTLLKYLHSLILDWSKIKECIFSSVKPEKNQVIYEVMQELNIKCTKIQASDFNPNDLKINSKINISEVGTDILLNAYYIAKKYNSGIIISFGTATVIIKVLNKELLGVIIIPGVEKSLFSLYNNTSQINKIGLNYNPECLLGTNTLDAISLGVIKGTMYMIEGFIKEINQENLSIFYTGANIKYLINFVFDEIVDEMVTKGLILFVENNS